MTATTAVGVPLTVTGFAGVVTFPPPGSLGALMWLVAGLCLLIPAVLNRLEIR